jgi:hypothetical protein
MLCVSKSVLGNAVHLVAAAQGCRVSYIKLENTMSVGGQLYDSSFGPIETDADCYNYCLNQMLTCTAAQTYTNMDGTIVCVLNTSPISSRSMYRLDGARLYVIKRCNNSGKVCRDVAWRLLHNSSVKMFVCCYDFMAFHDFFIALIENRIVLKLILVCRRDSCEHHLVKAAISFFPIIQVDQQLRSFGESCI